MGDRVDLQLNERHQGFLVVGDIHGHSELMDQMIAHARAHALYFVSCGDLVDRGPDSVGCLDRMRSLQECGDGIWIRGNHEEKLFRALKGRSVKISTALAATLSEMDETDIGPDIRDWFLSIYERTPFLVCCQNFVIVHGAFGVRMLDLNPLPQPLRARALFGQVSRDRSPEGKPKRLYRWVHEVPDGITVLIGHDPCCASTLLERPGDQGGRAVHIDSAAGKDGPLSAIQIDRNGAITSVWQAIQGQTALTPSTIEPYSPERARQAEEEEVSEPE